MPLCRTGGKKGVGHLLPGTRPPGASHKRCPTPFLLNDPQPPASLVPTVAPRIASLLAIAVLVIQPTGWLDARCRCGPSAGGCGLSRVAFPTVGPLLTGLAGQNTTVRSVVGGGPAPPRCPACERSGRGSGPVSTGRESPAAQTDPAPVAGPPPRTTLCGTSVSGSGLAASGWGCNRGDVCRDGCCCDRVGGFPAAVGSVVPGEASDVSIATRRVVGRIGQDVSRTPVPSGREVLSALSPSARQASLGRWLI